MKKITQIIIDVFVIAILFSIAIMVCYNLYYFLAGYENTDYLLKTKKMSIVVTKDNIMSPVIEKNDVIIFKKCNQENLKKGDIVYLEESNFKKISRIKNIKTDNINHKYYTTKGDNNYYYNQEDVTIEQVEGKFYKKINFLGSILKIAKSKVFTMIIIIIIVIIIIIMERNFKKSENRRKKRERV